MKPIVHSQCSRLNQQLVNISDNPDDAIDEQVEQERLDDDAAAWEAFFEE